MDPSWTDYSNNSNDGDWILLEQKNFYKHSTCSDCEDWHHIGQILQIDDLVSGTTLTIVGEATKTYEPTIAVSGDDIVTTIRLINPIQNVGFENLRIDRLESEKAAENCFDCNNIYFEYAVNCWVKGVEMHSTPRHHVVGRYSSHLEISGSYFSNANNHGGGGYGYGVLLENCTTYSLVENNIFRRLRHSVLLQSGANSNVVTFNYARERKREFVAFSNLSDVVSSNATFTWTENSSHTLLASDQHWPQQNNFFRRFDHFQDPFGAIDTNNPSTITVPGMTGTYLAQYSTRFDIDVSLDLMNGGSGGTAVVDDQVVTTPYSV